jgi:hypothetical protein
MSRNDQLQLTHQQPHAVDSRSTSTSLTQGVADRPSGQGMSRKARQRRRRSPKAVDTFSGPSMFTRVNDSQSDAAVAYGYTSRVGKPRVTALPNGDTRIIHREYVADVASSTATFSSLQYPINPAMAVTFPWLSGVAQNYDKYRFNELSFKYEPSCSTATPGTVLLSPDYDAADGAPGSKTDALTYEDSTRSPPWMEQCMISCSENLRAYPQYYTRTGTLPANQDIKTYDTGNLWLCSQGVSAGTVGELWVEYDVTLITPGVTGLVGSSGKLVSGGGGVSATNVFGNVPALTGNLAFQYFPSAGGNPAYILFNQSYQGLMVVSLTGTVVVALTVSASTATITSIGSTINGSTTGLYGIYLVNANLGQTFVFDGSGSSTITASFMRIGAYQYSLG